jgi:hypothetical protein
VRRYEEWCLRLSVLRQCEDLKGGKPWCCWVGETWWVWFSIQLEKWTIYDDDDKASDADSRDREFARQRMK